MDRGAQRMVKESNRAGTPFFLGLAQRVAGMVAAEEECAQRRQVGGHHRKQHHAGEAELGQQTTSSDQDHDHTQQGYG